MTEWLQTLPGPCRVSVDAFAGPHAPGAGARARLASRAIAELAAGFKYLNPLVDVTPGDLLTAFITEAGIIAPRQAGAEAQRMIQLGVESLAPQ
jgi:translation initiation factor 2B subunit (eIF-2B alpha/beta/delta family)